jgi:capsid protein
MFAGFVTRPGADDVMGEDNAQKDQDGAALIGLQPGTMQLLLPGEDIKFSDPADVGGSYEAFQYRTLLACCAAMGVPYTNVTGDLRQANYSSLREGKQAVDQQFARWVMLHVQSNPLPICTRPRVLIKGKRT